METLFLITAFIFGTIIGSFLNVVIFRYNSGKTIGGRSFCFSCSETLKWYHMIPIFSYLFQRGRCDFCKSKISFQYLLIEALTGFVFMIIAYAVSFNPIFLAFYFFIFSILIVIAAYDMRHKIIPDGLVFVFIFLSIFKLLFGYYHYGQAYLFENLFSGVGIFLFFGALWLVSRGKWMGFGDAKLALGIGWFLPFCQNVNAIILAFFIGSFFGLFLLALAKLNKKVFGKRFEFKSEIPFAPFLIFSVFLVFIFNLDMIGLLSDGVVNCVLFQI